MLSNSEGNKVLNWKQKSCFRRQKWCLKQENKKAKTKKEKNLSIFISIIYTKQFTTNGMCTDSNNNRIEYLSQVREKKFKRIRRKLVYLSSETRTPTHLGSTINFYCLKSKWKYVQKEKKRKKKTRKKKQYITQRNLLHRANQIKSRTDFWQNTDLKQKRVLTFIMSCSSYWTSNDMPRFMESLVMPTSSLNVSKPKQQQTLVNNDL